MYITSFLRAVTVAVLATTLVSMGSTAQTPASDPCDAYRSTPAADLHGEHDTGSSDMATPAGGDPAGHAMATPGPAAKLPSLDLAFLDLMTPHHEGAVVMSEIALVRSERPEITTIAQSIIDTQSAEQAQMREWRAAWYPDEPGYDDAMLMSVFDTVQADLGMPADAGMAGSHTSPDADARAICTASEPFDLVFIDRMTAHHQVAIDMAEVALVAGEHEEIRTFAQGVIDTQSAELAQLQVWREQWFGATPIAAIQG